MNERDLADDPFATITGLDALEPLVGKVNWSLSPLQTIQLSQAISLKRIADAIAATNKLLEGWSR